MIFFTPLGILVGILKELNMWKEAERFIVEIIILKDRDECKLERNNNI